MAKEFSKYLKRFIDRNIINASLRDNSPDEKNNFTTIGDFIFLPILFMLTIFKVAPKIMKKIKSKIK